MLIGDLSAEDLFKKLKGDISKQGYSEVKFPVAENDLRQAAGLYVDGFLRLPEAEKDRYSTWIFPGSDAEKARGRCGYNIKSRGKGALDDKYLFHYNDYLREFVDGLSKVSREARDFLDAAEPIFQGMKRSISPVLGAFETEAPGFKGLFLPDQDHPYFFLRFIAYQGHGAAGHFDKGPLTEAIAESNPGLRIGPAYEGQSTKDIPLQEVTHTPDTAFLFTGNHISSVLPKHLQDQFPKGWHDVVEKGYEVRKGITRWSIVGFFDPFGQVYQKGWKERHALGGK
ncbi:MAG TPA: hypothetical protein VJI98_00295 [Candidatus Nanoarchaeia archaeon]|nr:hypothetical protein [Candidatus Nanoarchaeia archaeon]